MDNLELQLNFLEGNPIEFEHGLKIYKMSFSDINKKVGYLKYNYIIKTLCFTQDDIAKFTNDDIDLFTFLILYSLQSLRNKEKESNENNIKQSYFIDDLLDVLECLFNDSVSLNFDRGTFDIGENGLTLNPNNFYEFQSIIKRRNCLENIDEDKDNPANEAARQLLEKRKKAREKLQKAKLKQGDDDAEPLTIADLISIYAESEHMRLEDIFKYDIYQFNDQFNRMKIFKDYTVNIQALLAGAKNDDIHLQHWLSKIKNNDN